MLGFYLVAAHMAGDYLFQSYGMASRKLTDWRARLRHCAAYTACFAPIAFTHASVTGAASFLVLLFVAHFLTDSKRWRTSNPWPAMPVLHDQALHAVQIAVIGAVFL